MQLVVAEKPSVARDLARVLGVRPSGAHCFEGREHVITWCVGHLVELEEPAAYDPRWRAWRLDTLPMLPETFQLRGSRHALPQLRAVARLLRESRFRRVINACDAGREGELIFRYVYQYAGGGPPVVRLWISALTDDAIRRGLAGLRPGSQLDPLADAARSRSEADWLVGMNATRAVTAGRRGGSRGALYSIGRVQTPTLAMVVAREQAIRAFTPRPYWEVHARLSTEAGEAFPALWRYGTGSRLAEAELAAAVVARASAAPVVVERVAAKVVREPPPLLFDLTSLQRTANRRYGLSAARTLEIAQALYERHKLITYPRTDSRHLSAALVPELPAVFAALAEVPGLAELAQQLVAAPPRPSRRVVDDAKVGDHHAIIPTAARPGNLDRDAQRIYDLIARRFLGAFFPDAELAVTEAWMRAGAAGTARVPPTATHDRELFFDALPPPPDRFVARGRVRLVAGWQAVAGISPASGGRPSSERGASGDSGEDDSDSAERTLPILTEGQVLSGSYAVRDKRTTPPPRFTDATLLGAMESAGTAIDDEALRAAMRDCGLGTPATRAAVLETLIRREYLVRDHQHLVPTPTGMSLIEALPVASLASPELTGAWEARLARIARGEDTRAAFMADIARYVRDLVDAIRAAPRPPPSSSTPSAAAAAADPIGRCPQCRGEVVPDARTYACRAGCGFEMRNRVAGRPIDVALATALLGAGRSPRLDGFRSSAGKTFSAALILETTGELRFDFPPRTSAPSPSPTPTPSPSSPSRSPSAKPARPTKPAQLACPRCREGALLAGSRGWGCTRWRDGCRFVVWFEMAGKRLSAAQLRDLVLRGKTRKAQFGAQAGRLVLAADVEGGAARFEPS